MTRNHCSETHCFVGMPAVIRSAAMRRLMSVVERLAAAPVTVLITGETGVGKEVVARALHHYSKRCQGPWVDVSCTTLPEHLVESELFGYERGAFSGAGSAKPGLFELSHQGTLFLDEIGDLDLQIQGKLLRVLDGAPYYRLGGTRKVSVDTRILAATNRDLDQMVRQGRFRADLYHRLAQCRLEVPPLRERKEAIVPLAEFFLAQSNPALRLEARAAQLLQQHPWPGNVRELRNVVLRSALLADGESIGPAELCLNSLLSTGAGWQKPTTLASLAALACAADDSLPPGQDAARIQADDCQTGGGAGHGNAACGAWRLKEVERRHILLALEAARGRQMAAAGMLGISRRTLRRKLKQYGLEQPERTARV